MKKKHQKRRTKANNIQKYQKKITENKGEKLEKDSLIDREFESAAGMNYYRGSIRGHVIWCIISWTIA
jgi:hypothetical protein